MAIDKNRAMKFIEEAETLVPDIIPKSTEVMEILIESAIKELKE